VKVACRSVVEEFGRKCVRHRARRSLRREGHDEGSESDNKKLLRLKLNCELQVVLSDLKLLE